MTRERRFWDFVSTPSGEADAGRYEPRERMGEGATAFVWRAWDRELGRFVALKILKDEIGSREMVRKRFAREAQAVAQISHPAVAAVHDTGERDGRLYLAMEMVEGRPLAELLGERKTDARTLVRLLERAARGVAAAHAKGIVHRDLKPANILVSWEGEPKVVDFGVAHLIGEDSELTKTGAVIGTPLYMAPEQVQGRSRDISARTDVYALGAILYEMLTGRPPHGGESVTEIYGRIVGEDPMAPRRIDAGISREIEAVALKALDKDPGRRYADAAEFADDLQRFLDGDAVLAQPPGLLTHARKWTRRNRATATGLAVAAAAVLAVVAIQVVQRDARRADAVKMAADGLALLEEYELAKKDPKRGADAARFRHIIDTGMSQAIGKDPSNRAARRVLARLYYGELEDAERRGNAEAAAAYELLVRNNDDGTYAAKLDAPGTLTLDSIPTGAEAELREYVAGGDGRLEVASPRPLGRCPLSLPLKPGSYLVTIRRDGCRDVRCPVLAERGAGLSAIVSLYSEEEIGSDYVQVPAGSFIAGDDPSAELAFERRRKAETAGYFIGRHEVTCGEYLAFLNDRDFLRVDEAWARTPRFPDDGKRFWGRSGDRIVLGPGWNERWAVNQVSWEDAIRFCEWLSRHPGSVFRLPTFVEWERAARGADGRSYPWGNGFRWGFVRGSDAAGPGTTPPVVGSRADDESPFGARDMGAGVIEMCADGPEAGWPYFKGGCWLSDNPKHLKVTAAMKGNAKAVGLTYGFRVVKEPPKR